MTQAKQSTEQSANVARQLIKDGDDLVQKAMSAFEMPVVDQVQMAFPNVISSSIHNGGIDFSVNVQQLFAQQEQLFNPIAVPEEQPSASMNEVASQEHETQEMQAIRAMYEAD